MRSRMMELILLLGSAALAAAQTATVTVTGFLTDTLSGRTGANALNVESAKRNVASGKAKFAIYDEATKRLYILQGSGVGDQGSGTEGTNIEQYLGQRVKITGTLSPTPTSGKQSRTITRDHSARR